MSEHGEISHTGLNEYEIIPSIWKEELTEKEFELVNRIRLALSVLILLWLIGSIGDLFGLWMRLAIMLLAPLYGL